VKSPAQYRTWLRAALRSEAVLATGLIGLGGVGFAIGNLLLARALSAPQFGAVALFLAWCQIGMIAGTGGLEVATVRHGLHAGEGLLRLLLLVCVPVAVTVAAAAILISGLEAGLAVAVAVTVLGASTTRVAVAFFQVARRNVQALAIMQLNNYVLLAVVPLVVYLPAPRSQSIAELVAGGYLLTAAAAWSLAPRMPKAAAAGKLQPSIVLREGASVVGGQLAMSVLFQLERLVIPRNLSIEALASFAAVAAVAASPFRMLQIGISFTLMPRLRRCTERSAIGRLLRQEGLVAAFVALLTGIVVVLAMPWIHGRLLGGRYEITRSLTLVVVAVGLVRICESLASSTVNALGTSRDLLSLNLFAWCAVVVGAGLATYGSRWGLIGVLAGAGLAWLAFTAAGSLLGSRILRRRKWGQPLTPAAA